MWSVATDCQGGGGFSANHLGEPDPQLRGWRRSPDPAGRSEYNAHYSSRRRACFCWRVAPTHSASVARHHLWVSPGLRASRVRADRDRERGRPEEDRRASRWWQFERHFQKLLSILRRLLACCENCTPGREPRRPCHRNPTAVELRKASKKPETPALAPRFCPDRSRPGGNAFPVQGGKNPPKPCQRLHFDKGWRTGERYIRPWSGPRERKGARCRHFAEARAALRLSPY